MLFAVIRWFPWDFTLVGVCFADSAHSFFVAIGDPVWQLPVELKTN